MRDLLSLLKKKNVHIKLSDGDLSVKFPKGKVDKELLERIKSEKQSLISYLNGLDKFRFTDIPAIPEQAGYALSSSQRRLWIMCQFPEGNTAYNTGGSYRFEGILDRDALASCFATLIHRHESLRTVFREDEQGNVLQFVNPPETAGFTIGYEDFRMDEEKDEVIRKRVREEYTRPFDLVNGPLIRAILCQAEDDKWVFCYVVHHIVSDGWSISILIRELFQLYNAVTRGEEWILPPLRIQYKDYASWQQEQLSGERLKEHRAWWLKQFGGTIPVLELPGDSMRPSITSFNGGTIQKLINKKLSKGLKGFCLEAGGTLFMGLMAAVELLLCRYTGQEDIIIGTPIAGRDHADLEDQIGYYGNMLSLRVRMKGTESYRELFSHFRAVTMGAFEHQVYPFDELVNELNLKRDRGRHPLFDVTVALQNADIHFDGGAGSLGGLTVRGYEGSDEVASKFDLSFDFGEMGEEIRMRIAYNSDIYSKRMVLQMAAHLEQLLGAALTHPDEPVYQLAMLSAGEMRWLSDEFNNTATPFESEMTIPALFEEQAGRTPDKTALIFEERFISYRELDERSNRLANYLVGHYGIRPEDRIGILLDRSENLLISILGILKSGAAYVPVDLDFPQARKEFIMKDTGIKLLITQSDHLFDISYYGGDLFAIDIQMDTIDGDDGSCGVTLQPGNLAYVMYTSGSTGQPKGVMVEHRGAVRLVRSAGYVKLTGAEVLLSTGAVSFDATTFEYWSMLLNGGTLVLSTKETLLDVRKLKELMRRHAVDTMWFTAGWLHELVDTDIELFGGLRTLLAGGDKLSPVHINAMKEHYPGLRIINGYGPTENTTFSLTYDIEAVPSSIPIGKPVSNSTAYIVDQHGQVCPIGVIGEICVGGAGLARGYLNNPALTAQKFVMNPVIEGDRVYKTGDLGKWLPDGNMAFAGRKDDQVKMRGYRVEPGEIEHVLQSHPAISSAAVVARSNARGEKELIAYTVSAAPLSAPDIRDYLGRILPEYMVPDHYVALEQLPLTANGKVDRNNLPDPRGLEMPEGMAYIAPRNATEEKLAALWEEILGRERIGVKDDFFDSGGHSLRATRLVSQIRKIFDVKVELKDLFTCTVLEEQAEMIMQASRTSFAGITTVAVQDSYAVSSSQRRLWVLSQFEEANMAYNIAGVYVFEGELDVPALEASFKSLIERHENLRTVFREGEQEEVRQYIRLAKDIRFQISYRDLRQVQDNEQMVKDLVRTASGTPFDLSEGPLLRCCLYQVSDNKWIFNYVMHHIISDGWSMNILIRELLQCYNAYHSGYEPVLPPLRIQYKDYAAWQQEQLSNESSLVHEAWWLNRFSGELPVLAMPEDSPRPKVRSYRGGSIHKTIDAGLSSGIKAIGREQGATLFMSLLAAVDILLYRYTGQEDIITGTPIAGREHADLDGQIGFFVNTLALRIRVGGRESYKEILEQIREVTLGAYEHQVYPFDELVDKLSLQRDMNRNPLFDVMVVLQNNEINDGKKIQGPDKLRLVEYGGEDTRISKFDLLFHFVEINDEIRLDIVYNSDLFGKKTVERLGDHFVRILNAITGQSSMPVGKIDFLGPEEKQELLAAFNDTAFEYPKDRTIIQLFEEQAAKTPDNIALIFEERTLTYQALNEHSNRLGNYLRKNYGIMPDDLAGIKLERGEWMVICMLGVLKSGGAYVPVDPEYPQERIDYMLEDCTCKVLIDDKELSRFLAEESGYDGMNPPSVNKPGDLAYVMYTSGSTGQPKGVEVAHTNVVRLVKNPNYVRITEEDRILSFSNFSFDGFTFDIYGAILNGAALALRNKDLFLDLQGLDDFIRKNNVTTFFLTTALFNTLSDSGEVNFQQVRQILFGGELVSVSHVRQFMDKYPSTDLIHVYGPTENTTFSSWYKIGALPADSRTIPIGSPVSNTELFIFDANDNPAPVGVAGEICTGGAGLARRYRNKPELTAQKFVPNPVRPGQRMYRTGDLGRWLPDGNIVFMGRKDDQVKVRGYRIEPGEIENVIKKLPGIDSVIVVARTNPASDKELVAYIVSRDIMNVPDMRAALSRTLPVYMIPAHFVQLEQLPLTANGKVDKKALPDPADPGFSATAQYEAPRNKIEEQLISVWQDILARSGIGVKDNFFELGGHSLKATRLAGRIARTFNVKLALKAIFMYPVLEEQAQLIAQSGVIPVDTIPVIPEQPCYALSSSQRRLWVLSQLEGGNIAYNIPGVIVLDGELDRGVLEFSFATLVGRHETLRTVFKTDEAGEVMQFIRPAENSGIGMTYRDLRSEKEREEILTNSVREACGEAFDLAEGPLLRTGLYRLEDNKWVLCYVMHHIISDGWSMDILIRELLQLYNAGIAGEPQGLPPLRIQYKDYAAWQQAQLNGESLQIHKSYWEQQFEGELPVLDLPGSKPRPSVKTYNGRTVYKMISPVAGNDIMAIGQEQGATLFMSLLAVVNVLLFRYTGQEDIVIGTPIAGRVHADLVDQIGFYVNTLALRTRINGRDNYRELLGQIREMTLGAYEHQVYPFDELVGALDLPRDISRSALFDVMVILQNDEANDGAGSRRLGELTVSPYAKRELQTSKFDLQFNFVETGEGIQAGIRYNTDIYDEMTIRRMGDHLEQLISAIIAGDSVPICLLDYLGAAEKHQLLTTFSNSAVSYPAGRTIVDLFDQQVRKTPDDIALVFEGKTHTYQAVHELTDKLARYLITDCHVQADDIVGIMLERSDNMIIALMSILKSGGAYVAIEPDIPVARKEFILKDAGVKTLITQADHLSGLGYYNGNIVLADDGLTDLPVVAEPLPLTARPAGLAYVIYTSGSTGEPKGVMISHQSLVDYCYGISERTNIRDCKSFGLVSTIAADLGYTVLYPALTTGGRLHIFSTADVMHAEKLIRADLDCLKIVPSHWKALQEEGQTFVPKTCLIFGGEQLTEDVIDIIRANHATCNVYNHYGPSETTIGKLIKRIDLTSEKADISLGSPFCNTAVYITDAQGNPVPIGVAGEICIAGEGLARGYLNQPGLTAQQFVANPFREGERMYRTGDLGRWLPDGSVAFLGRRDDQIKIRGYRVESEEIRSVLQNHPAVDAAFVMARTKTDGDKELVAYIAGVELPDPAALRIYLLGMLPAYMAPECFVRLTALPLTANGKVDRKKLPDPDRFGEAARTTYIAPRSDVEKRLALIWAGLLGKENIGVKDDFFGLGGHSLKATRLAGRIHKVFDVRIALKDLFTSTILEDQARLIAEAVKSSFTALVPAPLQPHYALSSSQRRLWVLSQFEEGNVAYNMPRVYQFEGALDYKAFTDSIDTLLERHESLRTVFRADEQGDIRQFILSRAETGFKIAFWDMRAEEGRESVVGDLVRNACIRPFDLAAGPLLKAYLFRLEDNKWVFTYVMHHIITDGWSMSVLIRETLELYNAYTSGRTPALSPLKNQFKDYVWWQERQLKEEGSGNHKAYWLNHFAGELPVLQLPGEKPRPAIKTFNGADWFRLMDKEIGKGINALCQEQGCTLFMGLLAAVNILLYRYTGLEDIIIGTPIAGREHADLEDQIGFYVNTLALRTRFSGGDSYRELLDKVREVTLGAHEHQVYPFDELVNDLHVRYDRSRNPLFDIQVVLGQDAIDPVSRKSLSPGGLKIGKYENGELQTSRFDIVFAFIESSEGLMISIIYNTDLYDKRTIDQFAVHLELLLAGITANPGKPIDQLEFLTAEEKQEILVGFNDRSTGLNRNQTVLDLFGEQVKKHPGQPAVMYEETKLTYRELDEKSNALANYLRGNHDLRPDDFVGIMLDRSEKMIISIWAALKAGVAYVPIDPEYPAQRKEYIIRDTQIKLLITQTDFLFDLEYYNGPLFAIDIQLDTIGYAIETPGISIDPDSLAYIIYTSGSTGQPKGVMVEHRNLSHSVAARLATYPDVRSFLLLSSIAFDSSVAGIFGTLCAGGALCITRKTDVANVSGIADYLVENRISHLLTVPSYYKLLIGELAGRENGLTQVIVAGENCPRQLVEYHYDTTSLKSCDLFNEYGPTEGTVWSSVYKYEAGKPVIQTIGKPIGHTQIYILGNAGNIQPVGVPGEIYIGGGGVARGYLRQEELTGEKFLINPFRDGERSGKRERMYRTGDLAKWLPDGNIAFLGRNDDQVKIRGYRIELGEIESALQSYPGVDFAVVIADVREEGNKELVAYVVSGGELTSSDLQAHLGRLLPAWSVPAHYVGLKELPLTPNGKVDRKRLPKPAGSDMSTRVEYVAPENDTERKLVSVWEEILDRDQIGMKDDFFLVGGHSLRATRLASLIHKQFDVKVELKDLFDYRTVREQAQLIAQAGRMSFTNIPVAAHRSSYPLSSSQLRLWILSQFDGGNFAYNIPGVYVLEGNLERDAFESALADLVERHETLRTVIREDENGEVKQFIRPTAQSGYRMNYKDLRAEQEPEEIIKRLIGGECRRTFDLSEGPLLHTSVYRLGEHRWVFSYLMHHIVSDGWSMGILIRELRLLYNARIRGQEPPLKPLRIQYKDYAAWEQEQLSGQSLQEHRRYWLGQFGGILPVLDLPVDKIRPAVQTFNGGIMSRRINAQLSGRLKKRCQEQGATLFMGLLTVVNTLLYRYTDQHDIVIGTPMAGRDHADLEDQIGFYINTLALRTRFNPDNSFSGLLDLIRQVTLEAYEHKIYPFDQLVEDLNLQRDMSRSALFDVMVTLHNHTTQMGSGNESMEGLVISQYKMEGKPVSKFDLSFDFSEAGEELVMTMEYNIDIYGSQSIGQMADHLLRLLEAGMEKPGIPIRKLDYLSEQEKSRLLTDFNPVNSSCFPDKMTAGRSETITSLFEMQAERTPDRIAVVFEAKEMTYSELNARSNQLAGYLRRHYQVQANDLAGIKLDKNEWLIVTVLGILKSGAAYVPIDPDYPADRIDHMTTDSQCKVMIDGDELTRFAAEAHLYGKENIKSVNGPDDLAYVIYTSGSSGRPKGVMIEHRSVVSIFESWKEVYLPDNLEVNLLQLASVSFDVFMGDICRTLLAGGKMVLCPNDVRLDPESLYGLMQSRRISILEGTPGLLLPLMHYTEALNIRLDYLKVLIFGSDTLPISSWFELQRKYGHGMRIINTYGTTETAIDSTYYEEKEKTAYEDNGKTVRSTKITPIGRPFSNTRILILDPDKQLVPVGVAGDIYITGPGLARGYLNQPVLTADRFIANPFGGGERMYKTGDAGRWLSDGNIVFNGRKDEQVKIRGYRVEPGEIESALLGHESIHAAVAHIITGKDGEKEIAAYVTADKALTFQDIRVYLGAVLPAYMLPAHFVQLEALPLTPNGKVDRAGLPDPQRMSRETGAAYAAPRNETEEKILSRWQQVLGIEKIGIRDNFFDLGGHSLKASRLAGYINKDFNIGMKLVRIFTNPTIEGIAGEIGKIILVNDAHFETEDSERVSL